MVSEYLDGWKEIATAIGVTPRTAQRMRLTYGLPVANVTPRRVIADRKSVDEWLSQRVASCRNVDVAEPASDVRGQDL
jgi:hypothetical protein